MSIKFFTPDLMITELAVGRDVSSISPKCWYKSHHQLNGRPRYPLLVDKFHHHLMQRSQTILEGYGEWLLRGEVFFKQASWKLNLLVTVPFLYLLLNQLDHVFIPARHHFSSEHGRNTSHWLEQSHCGHHPLHQRCYTASWPHFPHMASSFFQTAKYHSPIFWPLGFLLVSLKLEKCFATRFTDAISSFMKRLSIYTES